MLIRVLNLKGRKLLKKINTCVCSTQSTWVSQGFGTWNSVQFQCKIHCLVEVVKEDLFPGNPNSLYLRWPFSHQGFSRSQFCISPNCQCAREHGWGQGGMEGSGRRLLNLTMQNSFNRVMGKTRSTSPKSNWNGCYSRIEVLDPVLLIQLHEKPTQIRTLKHTVQEKVLCLQQS